MFTRSGNKFERRNATAEQKQAEAAVPTALICVGNNSPLMAHGIFANPEKKELLTYNTVSSYIKRNFKGLQKGY